MEHEKNELDTLHVPLFLSSYQIERLHGSVWMFHKILAMDTRCNYISWLKLTSVCERQNFIPKTYLTL